MQNPFDRATEIAQLFANYSYSGSSEWWAIHRVVLIAGQTEREEIYLSTPNGQPIALSIAETIVSQLPGV